MTSDISSKAVLVFTPKERKPPARAGKKVRLADLFSSELLQNGPRLNPSEWLNLIFGQWPKLPSSSLTRKPVVKIALSVFTPCGKPAIELFFRDRPDPS